jgi:trimethylamine:corrinoid methyltransferase-like protein
MPLAALKLVRKTIIGRLENSREVTKMALERLILFSDDELERVHETSLKTLQEVGIKVVSKKV